MEEGMAAMRESLRKKIIRIDESRRRFENAASSVGGGGKPAGRMKPVSIEAIDIRPNLGLLLLELPPRYVPMMPNGVGHLYNILARKASFDFQLLDFNIIAYHYINQDRNRFEAMMKLGMRNDDPWDDKNDDYWHTREMIHTIWSIFETLLDKIEKARPRILGLSINACNRTVVSTFADEIRQKMPEMRILVGGHDCTSPLFATRLCRDFDYMVIGEAEEVIVPLVERIMESNGPVALPGVISRGSPAYIDEARPPELDGIGFPNYEWVDLDLYRRLDGVPMPVPITSSRGCKWGRCRFCIEGCEYRKRSPQSVVDEIEYFKQRGFDSFQFNESDANGDPQNLHDICSLILERGIDVNIEGQLRIDKRGTREFFEHLAKAGFIHIRFGIDGWTDRSLKLQNKGYSMKMVEENLRAASETDLFLTVNAIVGVPGETEDDVDEMIRNIIALKEYFHLIGTFNTLLLIEGSEYYEQAEKYHIRFRIPKDEIKELQAYVVPSRLWYSEEPYIDQEVRLKRMKRIVESLCEHEVFVDDYAWHFIRKLELY
jgi:radical SAM superfamily enzyme YgiQ (UPF0313 family)